jgi:ABC-2 type transport system ATP-binding protein
MLDLVRRVGSDFGISIVVSTHLMGDVERVCDSVVVLDAGRLLRTGAVSGLTEETEALEIELVEGAPALLEMLAARGLTARLDGRRLTLEQVAGEDYDVIRDAIVASDALLYRLAPARLALADVFSRAGAETGNERNEAT